MSEQRNHSLVNLRLVMSLEAIEINSTCDLFGPLKLWTRYRNSPTM